MTDCPCASHARERELLAEIERLRKALDEVRHIATMAGSWRKGCACLDRIPQMGEIANAALLGLAQTDPVDYHETEMLRAAVRKLEEP